MDKEKVLTWELIGLIRQGDMALLQNIMQEISDRYRREYPDWDVIYLALPKHDRKTREETFRWLEEHAVWDLQPGEL